MNATKIGFVLLSNSKDPVPSTRIAVLNMFPFLRSAGFEPHIVFEPETASETPDPGPLFDRLSGEGYDIVVFQKVHGPRIEALAHQLRDAGIATVYGVCDLVDPAMAAATTATVIVTDYLKSLYPIHLQGKIHVVHDGIERPALVRHARNPARSDKLRAVLVTSADLDHLPVIGNPPDWLHVTIVGRYGNTASQRFRAARWKLAGMRDWRRRLRFLGYLANPRIRCQAWHPDTVYEAMQEADVAIIPIDTNEWDGRGPQPLWKVKSENRLTMKMCLGLPTVATPIPSYEPVLRHGDNGFFAHDRQQWLDCLSQLRDPGLREAVGRRARDSVMHRYSMEEQARKLIDVLRSLPVRRNLTSDALI